MLISSRILSSKGFSALEAVWFDLRFMRVSLAIAFESIPTFYNRILLMMFYLDNSMNSFN